MKTLFRKPVAWFVLGIVSVLCVAGTKISRLTKTTFIDGSAQFVVVTGSTIKVTREIDASNMLTSLIQMPQWSAGQGEANTATNIANTNGSSFEVFRKKTGVRFDFNTLEQGSNVVLFRTPTSIVLNASAPAGAGGGGPFNISQFDPSGSVTSIVAGVPLTNPYSYNATTIGSLTVSSNVTVTNNLTVKKAVSLGSGTDSIALLGPVTLGDIGLSLNRPLYKTAGGLLATMAVSPSELNTLIGITGDVQPQLDARVSEQSGVSTNQTLYYPTAGSLWVTGNQTNNGLTILNGLEVQGAFNADTTVNSVGGLTVTDLPPNEAVKASAASKLVTAGFKWATSFSTLSDGNVFTYRSAHGTITNETPTGIGEVNSGVNLGNGQQLFAGKSGLNLQFNTLSNSDASIGLSSNGNVVSISVPASAIGTAKLTNGGVTFAKMQDITTQRVLGRSTAGTGSPEQLQPTGGLEIPAGSGQIQIAAQGVDLSKLTNASQSKIALGRSSAGAGSFQEVNFTTMFGWAGATSTGDLVYRDANGNATNLAIGTVGYVLAVSNGVPIWKLVSASPGGSDWTPQAAGPGGSTLVGWTNSFYDVTNSRLTVPSLTVMTNFTVQERTLGTSGTNLVADGNKGTRFSANLSSTGNAGVTNALFQNLNPGQRIQADLFVPTGLTVNLLIEGGNSPPASWYTDGAAIALVTNAWNVIEIWNNGNGTNIMVHPPTYALVFTNGGSGSVTDYVNRVIIVAQGTGSGSTQMVAAAVGTLTMTNQIVLLPQEFNGSNGATALKFTNQFDFDLGAFKALTNELGTNLVWRMTNAGPGKSAMTIVSGLPGTTNTLAFIPSATGGGTNLKWMNYSTNASLGYDVAIRGGYTYAFSLFCRSATNIEIWPSSDDPLFGGSVTNYGQLQFDPAKTWLVFMGDSITAVGIAYAQTLRTNYATWSNCFFITNQAVASQTYAQQTNIFWSNTLAMLPTITTGNPTNVIVSFLIGANDAMASSGDGQNLANGISNFVMQLHARNYKFVGCTTTPRSSWNTWFGQAMVEWITLVDSIVMNTNIDFVADFARVLPDDSDLNYYADGLHPTYGGHLLLAREWDAALRYGVKPRPFAGTPFRMGTNTIWSRTDHTVGHAMNDGSFGNLRVGTIPTAQNISVGGVFGNVLGTHPSLIAIGNSTMTTESIFKILNSGATSLYSVSADGSVSGSGNWLTAGTITMSTGGGGGSMLQFQNNGAAGRTYYAGSKSDGVWALRDNTATTDRLLIDGFGNFTYGQLALSNAFFAISNQIAANVVVQIDSIGTNDLLRIHRGGNKRVFTVKTNQVIANISLAVGDNNAASITNILAASATLDFPSTSVGSVADLPITVTGAEDGDIVSIGSVSASTGPILGSYSAFASNGVVYVRFIPTAVTQDPASGTFKVLVTKF